MNRELSDTELEFVVPWSFRHDRQKLLRSIPELPRVPGARWEHGIAAHDGEEFRLVFESVNSDWRQGVSLKSDRSIIIDGRRYQKGVTVLFEPPHTELSITCFTEEGMLWIWNVWDYLPQGVPAIMSQRMYSGMLVEERPAGFRYRCNEGRNDDDYDDLIFRIERTGRIHVQPGT